MKIVEFCRYMYDSDCNHDPLGHAPSMHLCGAVARDYGTIDLRPLSRPTDSWCTMDANSNR